MHWLREMLTPKRVLIFIVIALFLAFFSKQLGTVLLPFIIAVSFAVILEPVIGFLERRLRFPRSIAVLATLVAVGGVTWYGIVIVVGQLVGQLIDLGSLLPVYRETITEMTEDLLFLQALIKIPAIGGEHQTSVSSWSPGETRIRSVLWACSQGCPPFFWLASSLWWPPILSP